MSGGGGGGSGDENEVNVELNLVPLIDILTNILFFLLVGFASQQAQFEVDGNMKLPVASSEAQIKTSIAINLTKDELIVDKVRVARLVGNRIEAPIERHKILPLYERLNTLRAERQAQTGGVSESDDAVLLLADREIPFQVLSPIMKTAAMAGYPNFRFAVIKK